MTPSSYLNGLVLVFISTIVLSTAGVMARLVSIDSATIVFWRGLAGGVALLLFLAVTAPRMNLTRLKGLGRAGFCVAVVTAIGMMFFIAALRTTSVAHVSIIFAVCPFISAGLGFVVLGERPGRAALVASGVALVGVVIMVGTGTGGSLVGDLLALGMTFCVALSSVLVRRYPDQPALVIAGLAAFISAYAALPFATPLTSPLHDIVVVSVFGAFAFTLGIALLLYGARLLPPVETALIGALDAPLAPFWVWLFFAETLDGATLTGGGIVMAAVLLHVLSDLRGRNTRSTAAVASGP
ncbi:DMT family transporter [Neorhizobium alkalisoli]|uniref:EamA domain-containing membrane protein RarD n=1 Tax=Neorhizobium alkalisoli TaxID=528178 RepID=A0A561QWZ2_9HYPH|nr:DMT family transporter [Neorhizobium alkalisoli]TWF54907.1 EamA domain-containing membrane protein RarD [Neorhizobium alkalisoli]